MAVYGGRVWKDILERMLVLFEERWLRLLWLTMCGFPSRVLMLLRLVRVIACRGMALGRLRANIGRVDVDLSVVCTNAELERRRAWAKVHDSKISIRSLQAS